MVNVITNVSAALAHAGHHGGAEGAGSGGLLHALTHADHLLALAAAAAGIVFAQRLYRLARQRRRDGPVAAVARTR